MWRCVCEYVLKLSYQQCVVERTLAKSWKTCILDLVSPNLHPTGKVTYLPWHLIMCKIRMPD